MQTELKNIRFLWTIGMMAWSSMAFSQKTGATVDQHIKGLIALWTTQEALLDQTTSHATTEEVLSLFQPPITLDSSTHYANRQSEAIKQARADLLRKDLGLSASANYMENLNPGPGEFEDNLVYDRRLVAGVSMDFLKSGWVSNHLKARALELENEMNNPGVGVVANANYGYQRNLIIYQFNLEKLVLLKRRQTLLTNLMTSANALKEQHLITRENYLELAARYAENEQLELMYSTYNSWFIQATHPPQPIQSTLPAIHLDLKTLENGFDHKADSSTAHIENAEYFKNETSPIHDITLKSFLRYNYYDLTGTTNARDFFSLGLSLGAPIAFNHKEKDALVRLEMQKLALQNNASPDLELDVLNHYYEFMYKWKQYQGLLDQRLSIEESLRKSQAKLVVEPDLFQPIRAIKALDNWMKTEHEIIDLRQQMYLKALKIIEVHPNADPAQLVTTSYHRKAINQKDWVTNIYAWTAPFKAENAAFTHEFLRFRDMRSVYMSFSKNQSTNAAKFRASAVIRSKGGEVHAMIGNNNLININVEAYLNKILTEDQWKSLDGIHLDVEPHTFGDYKARKEEYLDLLGECYKQAAVFCKKHDLKLSGSIPLHYPESFYRDNLPVVDHFVLMAYENVNFDYLERKLKEIGVTPTGYKVALRTADFTTIEQIKALMKHLTDKTGITQYVMHDLRSVIEFEESVLPGQR